MDNLKEKAIIYNINNSDSNSGNGNNFRYVSFSESLEDVGYQSQYIIEKEDGYEQQRYIRHSGNNSDDDDDYNNYEDSIKVSLIQKSFIKNKKCRIIITVIVVILLIIVSVGLVLAWQGVFNQSHNDSKME